MIVEIATPMYGGQCHGSYHISVIALVSELSKRGIGVSFNHTYNESLIQRARNTIASAFLLKSKSDVLLFIDSDIRFDAEAMVEMILEDKDVIGAITPTKSMNFNQIVNSSIVLNSTEKSHLLGGFFNFNQELTDDNKEDLLNGKSIKVNRIGTGVMSIKRNVFEKMSESATRYYDDNPIVSFKERFDFFPVTIEFDKGWGGNRMMSEDYNFCNKWVELGGEVWAKTGVVKSHSGFYEFQGDIVEDIKVSEILKQNKK